VLAMWLIVSLIAAISASAAYFQLPAVRKKYRLGLLALMLWGTTIMVFIDHLIAFLDGGPFITAATGGPVSSSVLLGIAMVIPIFTIWAFAAFTPLGKKIAA